MYFNIFRFVCIFTKSPRRIYKKINEKGEGVFSITPFYIVFIFKSREYFDLAKNNY